MPGTQVEGGTRIYLLDDSTKEEEYENMTQLSKKSMRSLSEEQTRQEVSRNINNAISNHVTEKYFCVFDADQAPEPEFLEATMDYFSDPKWFVQTPQYFINDEIQ